MKVLHYIPSIDTSSGGVGAYMQLLAEDLGNLVELHIVTHHSDDELKLDNCSVHYISTKFFPWADTKREFLSLLLDINPDVFHTNCCWLPLSAMTAMWAKSKGYRVVYSPHGMLEPWIVSRNYWTKKLPAMIMFQKRGIKCADVIHCTANSERDNFLRFGWNDNIEIIGNCVQAGNITMKQSWQRKNNILFLSRVHVKKGINFLIEAVSQELQNFENYRIIIAGPGEESYIAELKNLAKKLGVDDKVNFIGPVFGDKKYDLYREADLFVLPTHSENFGIVVAEALASGTPVITTKGTPWHELETHDCGLWVEVGTAPLRNALRSFLSKTETELERMGRNGRKLVEEKYDSKVIAKQFVDMYEGLISKNTATRPTIAAIILTKNEEKHIERCISSLKGICTDIVVVDSLSTDRTAEIAEQMGARVIRNPWKNYATQFNYGVHECGITADWIWRIDADEILEGGLGEAVVEAIQNADDDVNGIYVRKRIDFMGQPLLHGGWYPSYHLKVFRRGHGDCENRWMDEHIKIYDGKTITVEQGNQVDANLNDLTWWTDKHNGYATREMIDMFLTEYGMDSRAKEVVPKFFGTEEQRKRWLKLKYIKFPLFIRPFINFTIRYIFKAGFLDRKAGFVWHILQGFWYRMLVDAKIYELKNRFDYDDERIKEWLKQYMN